ncbi:MAG: hypothetical protein N2510_03230 [Ignavibacteria bacterium]|nr:hypothetical protein [Ignavibacteria bacterium]
MVSKINYFFKSRNIFLNAKNFYSSSVTKLSKNLYRDFDNLKVSSGYYINPDTRMSLNYKGQFFSDDRSLNLKESSSNTFYVATEYDGIYRGSQINSFLYAGYKSEYQLDEYNRGFSTYGEFNVYNYDVFDFIADAQLKAGYDYLQQRVKSMFLSRLYFERSFENNLARNEFDGVFVRTRKDFYFPADFNTINQFGIKNNIETRKENSVKIFNRFDYSLNSNISFIITLQPYFRKVTKENLYVPSLTIQQPSLYDTEIQEISLNGEVTLNANINKFNLQLKAFYRERDEKNFLINPQKINNSFINIIQDNESNKNNQLSFFQLNSLIYYNLNFMNRIELSGSASILKYDTPSSRNYEDRDELGYNFYVGHRFTNLRNLTVVTAADLSLYHTVYIFSQRSSNNNWNRVIRFTSKSYFTPSSHFRNVAQFSVLANYTVYDFEDIVSSVKSYVFRQLNLKDSVIILLPYNLGADLLAEIKFYERGELNWNSFSQRPVGYFEDKIFNPKLNYFFNKFITLSAGYKYYEQKKYKYTQGIKILDSYLRNYGPFAILKVNWKNNSKIEINASYDYYYLSDKITDRNFNIQIISIWNF